jgi:predicted tellurium resistance membrane protein TerC
MKKAIALCFILIGLIGYALVGYSIYKNDLEVITWDYVSILLFSVLLGNGLADLILTNNQKKNEINY